MRLMDRSRDDEGEKTGKNTTSNEVEVGSCQYQIFGSPYVERPAVEPIVHVGISVNVSNQPRELTPAVPGATCLWGP
jgi:hypothetical protein